MKKLAPIGVLVALILATPMSAMAADGPDSEPEVSIDESIARSGTVLGGGTIPIDVTVEPTTLAPFENGSIASGITALRTETGELYTTGANNYGQLGLGDTENRNQLERVAIPGGGTTNYVLASSSQTMWTMRNVWGNNDYNQYGDDGVEQRNAPNTDEEMWVNPPGIPINYTMLVPTPTGNTPENIVGAGDYMKTSDKQYTNWKPTSYTGFTYGSLTYPADAVWWTCQASRPYASQWLAANKSVAFGTGSVNTSATTIYGNCAPARHLVNEPFYVLEYFENSGNYDQYLPDFPDADLPLGSQYVVSKTSMLPGGELFADIDSRGLFGAALSPTGKLYTWGDSTTGALGFVGASGIVGLSSEIVVPELSVGDKLVQVATGTNYALALSEQGDVFAWGRNSNGQLGTGDTTDRVTPVKVASGMKYIMTSDETHSMAIDNSGKAWAWGQNSYGELGLGDNATRLEPTEVATPLIVPEVTATFGDTEVQATVTQADTEGTGKWKFDIPIPEHAAGPVPLTVTVNGEETALGTYTYTFTVALETTATDASVGDLLNATAKVSAAEAADPSLTNGVLFEASFGQTRSLLSATFVNGVAHLGTITSITAGEFTLSGQAPAVSGSDIPLSNQATLQLTFSSDIPDPDPSQSTATGSPAASKTATPGPSGSSSSGKDGKLASTGANLSWLLAASLAILGSVGLSLSYRARKQ